MVRRTASRDNAVNNARVEANLASSSLVRSGPWKASLDGTARVQSR